jgi:meso-butanediol dehydrogenase / (S,S)-butanediol dehydrogenase / diacetyl reductase
MNRLDGKVAIVTGGTKGIGRVIAAVMAAEGAKVVVTGRTVKRGEQVVANIREQGGDAIFVPTDVGDPAAAAAAVQASIDTYGKLTTLVNNAASTDMLRVHDDTVTEVSVEAWDRVLRVTLTGSMLMAKYAIARMIEGGGGSIINISAGSSERPMAGLSAYSAAKSAMNSLTRSIAVEYGGQNIRCNSILVGMIIPPGAIDMFESHDVFGPRLRAAHLTRLGRREDIAYGAVYLASDESGFVTGTLIPIEGGERIISTLIGKNEIFDG